MPLRQVVAAEGEYYHVYNRGALRTILYYSPKMYTMFLSLMTMYAEVCKISVIALCLMPNHFHILIRVNEGGRADRFLMLLCGVYSKRINKDLRRTGTIYEGRYKIKHVKTDSYFKCLCKYIHRNPVKAGLVSHPGSWMYSNYAECVSERDFITAEHKMVHDVFGNAQEYARYVLTDLHSTKIDDEDLAKDLADMRLV